MLSILTYTHICVYYIPYTTHIHRTTYTLTLSYSLEIIFAKLWPGFTLPKYFK